MFPDNETHVSASASVDIGITASVSSTSYKIIIFPFDQYELKIKLTPEGKFIEVIEVKINRDFLSHKQKMSSLGSFDIEPFLDSK